MNGVAEMCYSPCQMNSQKAIYNFPLCCEQVNCYQVIIAANNHQPFSDFCHQEECTALLVREREQFIILCVLCEYVELYGMCSARQSRHINIIDVAIVITKIPTLKRLGKLTSLANHIKTDCL